MSAIRRTLWATVLLAWPAVVIVKTVWKPAWGGGLSDGGAAFTLVLGITLLRGPGGIPRLRDWRHKRELTELRTRLARCEGRLNGQDAKLTALSEGIYRVSTIAGSPVPADSGEDTPTQPILRAI